MQDKNPANWIQKLKSTQDAGRPNWKYLWTPDVWSGQDVVKLMGGKQRHTQNWTNTVKEVNDVTHEMINSKERNELINRV
jgi:hypothetical protein